MKKTLLCLSLGLMAVAAPMRAAFESMVIRVTEEPQMPAVLRHTGLREGRVMLAIDVNAEGRLTDWLVVGASHKELIRPTVDVLKTWIFKPARLDGEPIAARQELTINFYTTGAVVSRTSMELVADLFEQLTGRRYEYEMCPASEVDGPLTAITQVSPEYAGDAQKLGVGGKVRVHFYVDEQGNVRLPAVPTETHPYLSAVAVEAMRAWKFAPPTRHGQPVLVAAVQEFNFGGVR
jgi:TonB family protein